LDTPTYTVVQIAKRFEPSTVLWAFHTIQPSSCVWNISGTAERICAKFTWKTCLIPGLNEFEGQGQRSRSPGTKTAFSALLAVCVRFMFGKTSLASSLVLNLVRSSLQQRRLTKLTVGQGQKVDLSWLFQRMSYHDFIMCHLLTKP